MNAGARLLFDDPALIRIIIIIISNNLWCGVPCCTQIVWAGPEKKFVIVSETRRETDPQPT